MKKSLISISVILILMLAVTSIPVGNTQQVYAGTKNGLKTPIITTKTMSRTSIMIKWGKIENAGGYELYRYNEKTKKYKKIKSIKNGNTISFIDKKRKKNKAYYYKVRAYKCVNGKRKYSYYAEEKEGVSGTLTADIIKDQVIQSSKKICVEIRYDSWEDKAKGFQLYKSNSEGGEYKKICTKKATQPIHPPSNSVAYYYDKDIDPGGTYYYKARAYKMVNGKRMYGKCGKPVAIDALNSIPKVEAEFFDIDGTTVTEMKVAITNNQYNGKLQIYEFSKGNFLQYSGKEINFYEYSFDDVNYEAFNKSIELQPGQMVYLKLRKPGGEPFTFNKSGELRVPIAYDRLPQDYYAPWLRINLKTLKVDCFYRIIAR